MFVKPKCLGGQNTCLVMEAQTSPPSSVYPCKIMRSGDPCYYIDDVHKYTLCFCSHFTQVHFKVHRRLISLRFWTHFLKSLWGLLVKIIYTPDRRDISRCWLSSMIAAQVCFGQLNSIKGHSTMCSVITDVSSYEGVCSQHAGWIWLPLVSNVAVYLTGLSTSGHVQPHQPRTSTSSYFIFMIV